MDDADIRLRIFETIMPHATRVGITNPDTIIESCLKFENYVIGSQKQGGGTPDSPGQKHKGKPFRG